MSTQTIEIATICLAPGRTEGDLIAASNRFQEQFLSHQPGFLRRELARMGEGTYIDLVHWRSMEEAQAVAAKIEASEACQTYFALMALDPEKPMDGVAHYHSLAVYP